MRDLLTGVRLTGVRKIAAMVIMVGSVIVAVPRNGQSAPDTCAEYVQAEKLQDINRKIEGLARLVQARAAAPQLIAALDAAMLAQESTCSVRLRPELPAPTKLPNQSMPARRPTPGELMARVDRTHQSPSASHTRAPQQLQSNASVARVAELLRNLRAEIDKPVIDYQVAGSIIDGAARELRQPSGEGRKGRN